MDCFEYEGKSIFMRYGIPIPQGRITDQQKGAVDIFNELGKPCVLKAQVLSGKRGKAGGIKIAETREEVEEAFDMISGMEIGEEKVRRILVEEKLDIKEEFYLGMTIDPFLKAPLLMFSLEGGMDIEELAEKHPEKLVKIKVNPNASTVDYSEILAKIGLENKDKMKDQLLRMMDQLVTLFHETDATTAEINPLVLTGQGELIAADSKLVIDDSAMFRQKDLNLEDRRDEDQDEGEKRAEALGLAFVPLDETGDIGTIAGGAGLALATMDAVRYYGGKPANFLDVGGGVTEEQMREAVRIVAAKKGLKAMIINVFGGINNCETMAKGIDQALDEVDKSMILVVKMRGHSQEEGWSILEKRGIPIVKHGTTEEAVKMLLSRIRGE